MKKNLEDSKMKTFSHINAGEKFLLKFPFIVTWRSADGILKIKQSPVKWECLTNLGKASQLNPRFNKFRSVKNV